MGCTVHVEIPTLKRRQGGFLLKFLGSYAEEAETKMSFMGFLHFSNRLEGRDLFTIRS